MNPRQKQVAAQVQRRGELIKEPIFHDTIQKWGWVSVLCKECSIDYDVRDVSNEKTVPPTHWPFLRQVSFDCPKGHHCEAIKLWNDHNFLKSCGIALDKERKLTRDELLANCLSDETPEGRVQRLAFSACVTAEVEFCGVKDGLCYFEACYTWLEDEPVMRLSVRVEDGLTTDQIVKQIGVEIERNKP
jgi:hypothetical protein